MLDRVDDIDAMALNVISVWHCDPRCMGRACRAHVANRFSWECTFDRLFGEVYPAAIRHAEQRASRNGKAEPSMGQPIRQTV